MNVSARIVSGDCILYTEVKKKGDKIRLDNCLGRVEEWCTKWQIMLNTEKTVGMTVTHKSNPLIFDYTLSGSVLEHVDSYRYLGVTIASEFIWDVQITNISREANRKLWSSLIT